jgi:6-phosphofructokinase
MKTAGILTVGGDTPALNALLKAIRDALRNLGFRIIYGFEGGFWGLITNSHKGNIIRTAINEREGGTFLSSLRETPVIPPQELKEIQTFPSKERNQKLALWKAKLQGALNTIKQLKIDLLIIIGGDGTVSATKAFLKEIKKTGLNCKIIFVPRTIDNDLATETELYFNGKVYKIPLCPGYPTAALNVAREAKTLRTTAASTQRIFTMQVMGRDAGWLALAATAGWAEMVLIPEVNLVSDPAKNAQNKKKAEKIFEFEISVERFLKKVVEKTKINNPLHLIISVSEGIFIDGAQIYVSQYGKRKLGGSGDEIARRIMSFLKEGHLNIVAYPNIRNGKKYPLIRQIEVRHHDTAYSPRKGPPSEYDIHLARLLGYYGIIKILKEEAFEHMPVLKQVLSLEELQGQLSSFKEAKEIIRLINIENAHQQFLSPQDFYDLEEFASSPAMDYFLYQILHQEEVSYP